MMGPVCCAADVFSSSACKNTTNAKPLWLLYRTIVMERKRDHSLSCLEMIPFKPYEGWLLCCLPLHSCPLLHLHHQHLYVQVHACTCQNNKSHSPDIQQPANIIPQEEALM